LKQLGYSSQFKKDYKRVSKSGSDLGPFNEIINALISETPLLKNVKDHKLLGQYKDRRELHLKSDLLLIYKTSNDIIILERMGSHSELFR